MRRRFWDMVEDDSSMGVKAVVISLVVCLSAVSVSALVVLTDGSEDTVFTLSCSDDGNFYSLTVDGNDHFEDLYMVQGSSNNTEFDQFIKENVTHGKSLSRYGSGRCSTFITADSDGSGYLTGRNYDYHPTIPCAVYVSGDGIYSSVSMADLAMYCDVGESFSDMKKDTRLNAAAYIPMDGVNEKGVYICINGVNNGKPVDQNNEGRLDIFVTSCLRVVLNHADSASKAVELISGLNLHGYADFHMFVCDNTGAGYAVEVIGDDTYVTATALLTNHYLTPEGKDVPLRESSLNRFRTMEDAMSQNPEMDREQVKQVLISVKQENPDHVHYTRWSVVYDLEERSAVVYLRIGENVDYEHGYAFGLAAA